MKIAIVTEYYYPLLGGITENVHHTATRLRARGHDVTIITSNVRSHTLASQELVEPAARVIRIGRSFQLPGNGSHAHATIGWHLWRDLRGTFLREHFDIAHLHSPLVFTLPAMGILAADCPSVGTFHTAFDGSRVYSLFRGILQKEFMDRLDAQTFVSKSCIASLEPFFRLKAPKIIPNGIDTTAFNPAVPRLEAFDESKRTLLFLGRFDRRNGLTLMLEAFALLRRTHQDVRLIVVGDGEHSALLRAQVPVELRQDVHFVGPVLAGRPRYYATCDIFCSPVDTASFGVTLLEAMASGKAIVATDNVGYRDLLGPEEGVLVPPRDAAAFADAIGALLDDGTRRMAMGAQGVCKARRFSWDHVVDETLDYYREILGRP